MYIHKQFSCGFLRDCFILSGNLFLNWEQNSCCGTFLDRHNLIEL